LKAHAFHAQPSTNFEVRRRHTFGLIISWLGELTVDF